MKRLLLATSILLGVLVGGGAFAGLPPDEIKVLAQKDIELLSDAGIVDAYTDVLVEMEAGKAFHATSGFTPKEYMRYKELLKYKLLLRFEIYRRKMELPPEVN
jgi:hypothetical protein